MTTQSETKKLFFRSTGMKFSIIIPAFNEQKTIRQIIAKVR